VKVLEEHEADDIYNEAVLLLNKGGDENDKKAAELLKGISESGHSSSERVLGFLYLEGRGVERDYKKAYDLISSAAGVLDPIAMYILGRMYEGGLGVEPSDTEALFMFEFAAEAGIPEAAADANRIIARIREKRERKLRSRPILNLEVSDIEVEAVCCIDMYHSAVEGSIGVHETYYGAMELMREDEDGIRIACSECPFCGKKAKKVSKNKIY
jgi:TPR repeat protein